jgi:hypothetical protein
VSVGMSLVFNAYFYLSSTARFHGRSNTLKSIKISSTSRVTKCRLLGAVPNPNSPSFFCCHRLPCGCVAKLPPAQDSDRIPVTLTARATILGPSGSTTTKINKQMSPKSPCDSLRFLEEAKNDSATRFAVRFVEVAIYRYFPHRDFQPGLCIMLAVLSGKSETQALRAILLRG